jgi:hypothetical protein
MILYSRPIKDMKGLVKQLSLELRIRKDGGGEHGGIGHKEGVEVVRIRQTSTSIERMTLMHSYKANQPLVQCTHDAKD